MGTYIRVRACYKHANVSQPRKQMSVIWKNCHHYLALYESSSKEDDTTESIRLSLIYGINLKSQLLKANNGQRRLLSAAFSYRYVYTYTHTKALFSCQKRLFIYDWGKKVISLSLSLPLPSLSSAAANQKTDQAGPSTYGLAYVCDAYLWLLPHSSFGNHLFPLSFSFWPTLLLSSKAGSLKQQQQQQQQLNCTFSPFWSSPSVCLSVRTCVRE